MTENISDRHTDNSPEVQDRDSVVGMSKASKRIAIVGISIATCIALFYIFFSNDASQKDQAQTTIEDTRNTAVAVTIEDDPVRSLPTKLPELPTLVAPVEPPPVPRAPPATQPRPKFSPSNILLPTPDNINRVTLPGTNTIRPASSDTRHTTVSQNRSTPMLVISGSGRSVGNSGVDMSNPQDIISKGNLDRIKDSLKTQKTIIDEDAPLERTGSEQVKATYIGDLNIIIAQGKLIDAVLETAVNTDLQGMLRAIVSRDVYSESGRNVLLPKGSRLIGQYNSNISDSQVRVDIVWNRVMRPDGIDLQINSPSTDQLGRTGTAGMVETKFGHLFMNSFLVSSINIAGAALVKKLFPNDTISTTTDSSRTSTTDTTTTSAQLTSDAIANLSKTFETVTKQYENNKPTIRVNQGTRVKVFVNKDLVFAHNLNDRARIMN